MLYHLLHLGDQQNPHSPVSTSMSAADEVYEDVWYKGEQGNLTVTDKVFHYQSVESKTSVKCSWARVEKRQLSSASASTHMIKLILVSGKTAVFSVANREVLEDLRNNVQRRMEASKRRGSVHDSSRLRQSQRDHEAKLDSVRRSSTQDSSRRSSTMSRSSKVVWQDEPMNASQSTARYDNNNDPCGWCCFGTLVCWILTCCICMLLAVAIGIIYWFVIKDDVDEALTTVGIIDAPPRNESRPPDYGQEQRYGIRSVDYEYNDQEVTLSYKLSDYILDNSISYILYDGMECRHGANDITRSQNYLYMNLYYPDDLGPRLSHKGTGTRGPFQVHFTLNKAQIHKAPFTTQLGLDRAQLNFCIGLSVDYNKVDYWSRKEEVNAVEVAVQMMIDMSDFRNIKSCVIRTIVSPPYNRRLLRGGQHRQQDLLVVEEEIDNKQQPFMMIAATTENEIEVDLLEEEAKEVMDEEEQREEGRQQQS